MKKVSVFSSDLLPYSQTFIFEQIKSLEHWHPTLIGIRKDDRGIDLTKIKHQVLLENLSPLSIRLLALICKLNRKSLMRVGRLSNPDLIHAHFGPNGSLMLPTAKSLRIPLVTTFHGYDITTISNKVKWADPNHKLFTFREDELKDSGNLFIAVSDFIKTQLLERNYPEKRVVRHYIGVDFTRYNRYKNKNHRKRKRILFVGRLVSVKGVDTLLEAFEVVQNTDPDTELVIVGDGPLRGAVTDKTKSSRGRISYLGSLNHQSVLKEINESAVLCVPSRTLQSGAQEAFGMVFAEAMSIGVPVVSTLHGGIPEVVKHGETGLLSQENDVNELAENLLTLLNDVNLQDRMGEAGEERIKEQFNIADQSRKLEVIYDSLI